MNEIVLRESPLGAGFQHREMPPGLTIEELLTQIELPDAVFPVVEVDGDRIPPEWWSTYRPAPGALVGVLVAPHGGGDSSKVVLRAVAAIAIAIAAVATGQLYGAALAAQLGFTSATAAAIAGGVISAGIAITGNFVVNSLIQPGPSPSAIPGGQAQAAKRAFTLTGTRNEIPNSSDVYPLAVGKPRIFPVNVAVPYTELVGSDQYINVLLGMEGPCEITNIKIGDTPIDSFSDVEYQIKERSTDPGIDGFPRIVEQAAGGPVLLEQNVWQTKTAPPGASRLSVDMVWPGGIWRNENGQVGSHTVSYEGQYREVGGGAWIPWFTNSIARASRDPFRRGHYIGPPGSAADFEVRVRVTSASAYALGGELAPTYWDVLRGIFGEQPVTVDDLALIWVRAKATDELNNQLDLISCDAHMIGKRYQGGGTWTDNLTIQNPSSCAREALQRGADGLPDSALDLPSFQLFHDFCSGREFQVHTVLERDLNRFEAAGLIASAGRGRLVPTIEGKWSIVIEDLNQPVDQGFSEHNAYNWSMSHGYHEEVHALRTKYRDKDNDFAETEILVLDDGYTEGTATKIRDLDFRENGVATADHAWKLARYFIASTRLRPERHVFSTDIEHTLLDVGRHIWVNNPSLGVGLGSGRIVSVTGGGTTLTVDGKITMESGKAYGIRARRANGNFEVVRIVLNVGEHSTVTLFSPGLPNNDAGDWYSYGELDLEAQRCIVAGIEPFLTDTSLGATVTAIPYVEAILNADTGTIPTFDPGITLPRAPQGPGKPTVSFARTRIVGGVDPLSPSAVVAITLIIRAADNRRPAARWFQVDIREQGEAWGTEERMLFDASGVRHTLDRKPNNRVYEVRARSSAIVDGRERHSNWSDTLVVDTRSIAAGGSEESIIYRASVANLQLKGGGTTATTADFPIEWQISTEFGAPITNATIDDTFKHFRIEILVSSVVVRTETRRQPRFNYTFAKNVRDNGTPVRSFEARVSIVDTNDEVNAAGQATVTFSNPAPAQLTGINHLPAFAAVQVWTDPPPEPDAAGVILKSSTTSGFNPETEGTVRFRGDAGYINARLPVGTLQYFKIAAFDVFGATGLNWSSEFSNTPTGLTGSELEEASIGSRELADLALDRPELLVDGLLVSRHHSAESITVDKLAVLDQTQLVSNPAWLQGDLGTITEVDQIPGWVIASGENWNASINDFSTSDPPSKRQLVVNRDFDSADDTFIIRTTDLIVEPGTKYVFSAWMYLNSASTDPDGWVSAVWINSDGTQQGTIPAGTHSTVYNTWHKVPELIAAAPGDAVAVRVRAHIRDNTKLENNHRITYITCRPQVPTVLIEDGSVIGEKFASVVQLAQKAIYVGDDQRVRLLGGLDQLRILDSSDTTRVALGKFTSPTTAWGLKAFNDGGGVALEVTDDTVEFDGAYIKELTVGTISVEDGAITESDRAYTQGELTFDHLVDDLQSWTAPSVLPAGTRIKIGFGCLLRDFDDGGAGGTVFVDLRLLRGAGQIFQIPSLGGVTGTLRLPIYFTFEDVLPVSDTPTYTLRALTNQSPYTAKASRRIIDILSLKK